MKGTRDVYKLALTSFEALDDFKTIQIRTIGQETLHFTKTKLPLTSFEAFEDLEYKEDKLKSNHIM